MRIIIQFHAILEEIVDFLNSISSEHSMNMTLMSLRPFTLREIDSEISIGDLLVSDSNADIQITLTNGRPNIMANSQIDFFALNTGAVSVYIGCLSEKGLKESVLSFDSDDKDKIAIAKKVASKLKKITKAGVVGVNPVTGAEANFRSHRYTEGAKLEYERGVKILPIAGHCFYKLLD